MYPSQGHPAGDPLSGSPGPLGIPSTQIARSLLANAPASTLRPYPGTQRKRDCEFALALPPRRTSSPFVVQVQKAPQIAPATRPPRRANVNERFGRRIRHLRVERNLTQTRMAEEFGIDRTFLSDLECGRKSLTLPTLETLARGFNMTLSELLQDV